jgi:D-alanyl-D-alanine carboxypeptidase
MKNILIGILFATSISSCAVYDQATPTSDCNSSIAINKNYSRRDTLEKLIANYTRMGVPGAVIAIYSEKEGYWGTSGGFAKIETKSAMQLCHLQYLQSAAKMYMASAILKLNEEGKIDLDAPITKYLPEKYAQNINKASTMSVRNLLNHASGMPDYLESPVYITYVLQHPDHLFTSEELLSYIKDKNQEFESGKGYRYSNTNFMVLSLIADEITSNHSEYIRQKVLKPLELNNTFYGEIIGNPSLVNSYFDRFSTGILENVSQMQQVSITFSKGDDGIIATPFDAIKFLKGLMEGKLLSEKSLTQMMTFVNDWHGKPTYGMGLFQVNYFGKIGYGHGGAGVGAGCGVYYFPDKKLYIFLGTNLGTLVDGPIVRKVDEFKSKVLELLLKY